MSSPVLAATEPASRQLGRTWTGWIPQHTASLDSPPLLIILSYLPSGLNDNMADLSAGTDLCNTYHPYRRTDGSANADSGAKVQNLSRHTEEGKHSGHMGNKVIHLDHHTLPFINKDPADCWCQTLWNKMESIN